MEQREVPAQAVHGYRNPERYFSCLSGRKQDPWEKASQEDWVHETLDKLPLYKVGKYGQLLEWREDYEEWELGHRHFSHLYPLFPANQINEYENPELVKACEKSLERRMKFGGGHTGWSCAWLINLYARLQNGDKAEEYIDYLLNKLTAPNMFDLHPPLERISGIPWVFQIDGNFGGACGIAQVLLQSHLDEIFLASGSSRKTGRREASQVFVQKAVLRWI